MTYRVKHDDVYIVRNNIRVYPDVYTISLKRSNHIVDFRYTSAERNVEDCVQYPTNRPGYDVVAAINGGAYFIPTDEEKENGVTSTPVESIQIRDTNSNMIEYSSQCEYNTSVLGLGIINNMVSPTYIYGVDNDDFVTSADMLRCAFRFSIIRKNGSMVVEFPNSTEANTDAQSVFSDYGFRIGIGFDSSNAYFVLVDHQVTGNELVSIVDQLGLNKFVNLDGGASAFMYDNQDFIRPASVFGRKVHETFYLMKKRDSAVDITGWGMVIRDIGVNIRSGPTASSTKVGFVPVGGELKIKHFLTGFQSDGYQWAAVWYNGIEGYSQIDTKCYTIEKTSSSVIEPSTGGTAKLENLYIIASSKGAYIRPEIANGDPIKVSAGEYMKVLDMIPGIQIDDYQWAYVRYWHPDLNRLVDGYVQMDTYNWHQFYSE